MSIATVSVRGDFAYVYDESGRTIGTIGMRGGVLSGYTSILSSYNSNDNR